MGVAGGSCSGKTSLLRQARKVLGDELSATVSQDSYYFDRREAVDGKLRFNFDHPDAIDFDLLRQHLVELKRGVPVDVPVYDFAQHARREGQYTRIQPKRLILVDGILILTQAAIVDCLDFSVFVECSDEVRLDRRIKRDVAERGRVVDNIVAQFTTQVRPMHEQFVEPSKENASYVFSQAEYLSELAGTTSVFIDKCREHARL